MASVVGVGVASEEDTVIVGVEGGSADVVEVGEATIRTIKKVKVES